MGNLPATGKIPDDPAGMVEKERSDLFNVHDAPRSIAPVERVLLPPAERRKQRRRRILIAIGAIILLALTAWAVRYFWHRHSVEDAALAAGDGGRPQALHKALKTLDSSELLGLRARLIGILLLAGEVPSAEAEEALEAVPETDAHEASERLKAAVYFGLASGEPTSALESASRLVITGDFAAESAHAQSLAQTANGLDGSEAAQKAVQLREGPRYRAQQAIALMTAGRLDAAQAALEMGNTEHPAMRTARARSLFAAWDEGADAVAAEVLELDAATRTEKAWATLVRAGAAARRGDRGAARRLAAAALEIAPPGDAPFRYGIAEILLQAQSPTLARNAVEELPNDGPIADSNLRGRVRAAIALSRADPSTALERLSTVAASPDALLLVGHVRRALGELREARHAYEQAAGQASHLSYARAALAQLELAEGNADKALEQATAAHEAAPRHPVTVPVLVSALIANDKAAEADSVVSAALGDRPNDVRLLAAKADVLLATEAWDEAIGTLKRAIEQDEDDAELHAELGDAAREAERFDVAREAYTRALQLDESYLPALQGLYRLHVLTGALEEAATLWERLGAVEGDLPVEVALARAQHLVDWGAGQSGARELGSISRRRELRRAPETQMLLGELWLQAENYNRAFAYFAQARRRGGDDTAAYLGQALAQVFAKRMNRATDALRSAADASLPDGAEEGAEPPARATPRFLIARGRVESSLGRYPSARSFAERALEAAPSDTEAHLLLAEIDARTRRDPTEHLRAAVSNRPAQPLAMARLALQMGATPEGCHWAERYHEAAPLGELREEVDELREGCGERAQ